jgi:MFS superfamily sulfate permease-like transporter
VVDVEGFVRLWMVSRSEVALAVFGMVAVMALDVLQGVLLALVASVVLMLSRIARPHDAVLTNSEDLDGWVDADQYGLAPSPEGLLVYRFDAPLFFVNATRFRQRLLEMLHDKPGVERAVVLDFEGVGNIDATAIDMLEALLAELSEEGKRLSVARANPAVSERLSRAGLLAPDGPLTPHATIRAAVRETIRLPDGTSDSRDR